MSDEFNTEGRGFLPGEDDIWESITAPDYTNAAIEFYNGTKEYVTTRDGNLVLTVRAKKTYWNEWNATSGTFVSNQMNYTSGISAFLFFASISQGRNFASTLSSSSRDDSKLE